jgi:hypothetical protein
MKNTPIEPPPKDSLKTLAEFTKKILRVSKDEIQDSEDSTGPKRIDEPCPET